MCREICGIYTQLKNIIIIVGWIFDVHLRQKHVLFAGLSIKDLRFLTQRDIQPTWESLQARDVHNIARLESSHKESQVLPASIIVQEASFPQNANGAKMEGTDFLTDSKEFKSHKSLQSNRLGS